jgi:tetratricopeptide (TPR) repeat protein
VRRASTLLPLALAVAVTASGQEPPAAAPGVAPPVSRDLDSAALARDRRVLIEEALRAGAYRRAQTLLLEEVERNPRSAVLLRLLGGVLFVTGEYLDAAIALKKAEALAPLDDRSRFSLAMSYVVMGQGRWARPELERLAAADPRNPLYPYWLARLEYDENRYASAVEGFRRALRLDPAYLKAHDNLGLALEALGRYDEAIKSHEEALRLDRGRPARSPWPALNLAILLTRLDRTDEAAPLLRESARIDARFAPARYQLGLLLEKKGLAAEAVAELTEAAAIDPHYPEPLYALARLYRRAGDTGQADAALERFLALKKEKGQAGSRPR